VIRRIAVVLAASMMLLGLAARPVQASWNACPAESFCTWSNTNYWGVFEYFNGTDQCQASRWDVSSIRNNRSDYTILYTNHTCSGTGFTVWAGQSFSPMPGQIGDNALRSFRMIH
jgi:hypothetical protein